MNQSIKSDVNEQNTVVVAAFYKFVHLPDYHEIRGPLLNFCDTQQIRGTLLLASEGINGTIAGSRTGVDAVLAYLKADRRLRDLGHKESFADSLPFHRIKVKLRKEIVTLGVSDLDPGRMAGTYVAPQDWNALISDPAVTLIDTRNQYEVNIGTFKNALSPNTVNFREFPAYVERQLDPEVHTKVAMFCTGGIRCEKATAYLLNQGFKEVYHLKGGILKYLEEVSQVESLWQGECFVFDSRVAVDHGLEKGRYDQCHGCRHPISEEDKKSPHYRPGISCPHCHAALTAEKERSVAERHRQVQLAGARGERHIGVSLQKPKNVLKR